MPIPSASSKNIFTAFKFFWACSIFFEDNQIFWLWSKARFYLINLHIWAWSKIFEHIQKILNTVKTIWTWSKNIWTSRWIRHQCNSEGIFRILKEKNWTSYNVKYIAPQLLYKCWCCLPISGISHLLFSFLGH